MNNKTKTTMFVMVSVLAAVMVAATITPVYAEIPEDLHDEAIEGKNAWNTLETLRNMENRTADNEAQIITLQARYDEIVTMLNEHAVPSPQQWDANEAKWIEKNAPPDNESEDTEMREKCGCTRSLKFIAGFKYDQFGFWPAVRLAPSWESVYTVGQEETSTVRVNQDYEQDIRPVALMKLTAPEKGKIGLDMDGYDNADNPIYNPRPTTKTVTAVTPFNQYQWFPIFGHANLGEEFELTGTLKSLR